MLGRWVAAGVSAAPLSAVRKCLRFMVNDQLKPERPLPLVALPPGPELSDFACNV
jgi:hypothetical protein